MIAPYVVSDPVHLDYLDALARGSKDILLRMQLNAIVTSVDYVSNLDHIDAARIGVYGVSMGGFLSLVAGALDTRIAVVVVNGSGGSFRSRSESALEGVFSTEDEPTFLGSPVASLLAGPFRTLTHLDFYRLVFPRPVMLEFGAQDFQHRYGGREEFQHVLDLYHEGNRHGYVLYSEFEGGHEINRQGPALAFLGQHLGVGGNEK